MRRLVNDLLDWHGAPVFRKGRTTHWITYTDILHDLEPLNEGRDKRDQITYDSLWVHAKRHYDFEGIAVYWARRIGKEVAKALGG